MKDKVFIVDDDELIVSMLSRALKKEGYKVITQSDAIDLVEKIQSSSPDLVLLDITLPGGNGIDILQEIMEQKIDTQVIMLTANNDVETAVKAMKLGAIDYLTKPFQLDEVRIVIGNVIKRRELYDEVSFLRKKYSEIFDKDIVGRSSTTIELKKMAKKLAKAHVSHILITGESGVGKEVFARYIHRMMYDPFYEKYEPFIAVNCSSLPEALVESELFGHEKGAFTDAIDKKKGILEFAQGGTVLLDEIGDMKPALQSKLLRVLEEKTIRRIGGSEEIPINATIITTTNRDILAAINKEEFRRDLYHRLNAFALHIPPLRERKEDIPALIEFYINLLAKKYNKKVIKEFSPDTERLILSYSWPGNVRELKNVVARLVVLKNSDRIMPEDLPKEIINFCVEKPPSDDSALPKLPGPNRFILPDSGISIGEIVKDFIRQALEKTKHNKKLAAKLLNISYNSLRYHIKKYRLEE